jgi:predicted ATPase
LALTLQEAHFKLDQVLQRTSAENLQLMQNESQKFAIARELDRRVDSIILESLRFSAMNYRQEDICKSYQNTYKWVLKDTDHISHSPWSSLVQWLRSGNGVYWMNGKAGSGKSTLMRYVYENLVTRALLRSWAQGGELQLAAFFCWYSGSAEQLSKSGLLRSLLYNVLLQHRELIRTVFADEWMEQRSLCYSGSLNVTFTWHVKRLQRAFVQLAQSADGRMKMCFFVDAMQRTKTT